MVVRERREESSRWRRRAEGGASEKAENGHVEKLSAPHGPGLSTTDEIESGGAARDSHTSRESSPKQLMIIVGDVLSICRLLHNVID